MQRRFPSSKAGLIGAALLAAAGWCGGAGGRDLAYLEQSSGLETPRMEGGRTEFELGDVNGDGHLDIVSIGDHGSPFINSPQHGVMVWFGDGAGNWTVHQTGNFGYGGVAIGDVNNDGIMDVGYGMHHDYSNTDFGDQLLEVALGDGTGRNWTPWDDGLATNGETWGMFGTDFADVDNDGDLDVASISFGCCNGVHVYLNNGDGTWTQSWARTGDNSSNDLTTADVNGDGFVDVIATHGLGTVYLGDGTGTFTPGDGNLPFGDWRRGVAAGDVNADGRDDVAFPAGGGVQVWTWIDEGEWADLSGDLASIGEYDLVQIADMNLDGFGDVIVNRDEFTRIYTHDGAGGWTLAGTIQSPDACDYVALRAGDDADHNGRPDILIATEEDCDPWTGGTNRPRFFVEATTPDEPFIHPVSPRGGEVMHAGSVRFIRWHAAIPAGEAGAVSIELSTDGPDGPWQTVAANQPSNGRHQWRLPDDLPNSTDCHLRLTLHTSNEVHAVTPRPFTIVGAGPDAAHLLDLQVATGTLLAGGLDDLRDSDDAAVHTRSGFGETFADLHNMTMIVTAATDVADPVTLDLAVESRIDQPAGTQRLALRNWATGEFEQVNSAPVGPTDSVVHVEGINAADYINDAGEIDLRLRHIVFVPFLAFTFESAIDQVEVRVQ